MAKSRYSLDRAISQFTLGKLFYSDLPDVACDALELGLDGPSIRRLASLQNPPTSASVTYRKGAAGDRHQTVVKARCSGVSGKRNIGRDVLAGRKEPLAGADEIWEICCAAGYPEELLIFGGLDQEFDAPQLIEECRILVAQPIRTYFPD
jgi:hypothetical protein